MSALLNRRKIIAEVEEMRALLRRAAEVEVRDPELAAALRRKPTQIGL